MLEGLKSGDRVEVLWARRGWLGGTFERLETHPDPDEEFRRVHVKMDNGFPCEGTGFHPDCVRALTQMADKTAGA